MCFHLLAGSRHLSEFSALWEEAQVEQDGEHHNNHQLTKQPEIDVPGSKQSYRNLLSNLMVTYLL